VAEGDIVALTDAMEKIGSMQESESKAASDYDAVDSIGKNVTNSSLYGVKKKEKVKPNLLGPEKTRLKNKMTIFVKEWFTQKKKYEKDTKPKTVVAGAQKKAGKAQALLSKEEGEKEGGGILDWISGLMGMLGLGGFGGKGGLMKMLRGWIWKGIKWAGGKIWGALKGVGKAAWGAIKAGFRGVGSFMSGLWSKFKGSSFWKGFTGAISRGVSAAGNVFSAAKNALQSGINTVGRAAQSALSSVTGGKIPKPGAAPKPSKPKKPSALKRFGNWLGGKAKAVKDWGAKKLSQAGKGIVAAKDFVVDKGKKAVKVVGQGVRYVGEKARQGVKWVKGKIVAPIKAKIGKYVGGMVKGSGGIMKLLGKFARIPIIGPVIEGFILKDKLQKLQEEYQASQGTDSPMTPEKRDQLAGHEVTKSVGGMAGAAIGGIVGNLIPIPIVGAIIGAIGGNLVGKFVGGLISKHILKDEWKEKIGQFALRSLAPGAKPSPKEPIDTENSNPDNPPPPELLQDFIWRPGAKRPAAFSRNDIVMGMKRGGPIGEMVGRSESIVDKLLGTTRKGVGALLSKAENKVDRSKGFFNRLLSNTNKTMNSLFGKTQETVKSLMSRSKREIPEGLSRDMKTKITSADGGDQSRSTKIAELQLKAIGVSNTYLSQLVQLTQALVKKPAGGGAGVERIVNISQPSNSVPAAQGDPSGPKVAASNVEFYNSGYSMHTPGTLT